MLCIFVYYTILYYILYYIILFVLKFFCHVDLFAVPLPETVAVR